MIRSILITLLILSVSAATQTATARPALLFDPSDGKVYYAEDIDQVWHPASVTKVMTAYVTFEAIRAGRFTLDSKIVYSPLAQKMPASKIGLLAGTEVTIDFALRALIIKSANDIAVALAEAVGGSHDKFVDEMNATAGRLGMTRTNFVNPNGLPAPEQVTTARDLAKLTRAVRRDYPEHAAYWAMSSMRVGKRRLRSHNSLLRTFEGANGIKTGFICDSGFNIVASATRGDISLVAIVLGEKTPGERKLRAANLLDHGFKTYKWKTYFGTETLDSIPLLAGGATPTSIRNDVPLAACNRALARARARRAKRARAARLRARKLRARKRRAEKLAAAKKRNK
ncbi:MAG: D-alanyl-D-alanine carboxypeptidase family protein [Hyphomicrobiaceae bacterium]